MSTSRIAVAVLGTGRVADLVARRIEKRADLHLAGVVASTDGPPTGTACVVYLPTNGELSDGSAAERVSALLRSGVDVVTTAPPAALRAADLLGACRAGSSTFHGTGGFQSSLITRVNRAFASITRNIRDVALTEERDVEGSPEPESYYDAGLRTLSEAVFGDESPNDEIASSPPRVLRDDKPRRPQGGTLDALERVVVQRSLGAHLAYDSVWTRREGSDATLRYRLDTTSADAIGHVTLTFHAEGEVRPADHLASAGLLAAIRPVYESAPGVLHHQLDINHVKPDDRLTQR